MILLYGAALWLLGFLLSLAVLRVLAWVALRPKAPPLTPVERYFEDKRRKEQNEKWSEW